MFRYLALTVGPPKTIYDLRKIDGAIRISCRECKRKTLLDREEFIMRRGIGESSDWGVICRELRCPQCASHDVKVQIEAFGQGLRELRRRRAAMITIELALHILKRALFSGSRPSVPVEAVRLALRALHPHLQDRSVLAGYWADYTAADPKPWGNSPIKYYEDMVARLLKRGYSVPAELRAGIWPSA
ncbi:hypothetical protein F1C10_14540 [Sphingomonas sp. NBWT7]|uniref:hypothetical protein n=1 Tax=Sphingomonas sp. NBWT7 TaxID=2596913 RepID=UPI0016285D1C|nr:hypothetical protein [Sphingomonas sp. NBWT7]QNE33015.1 hypothetical protein F1C10_14540 [Sphingomonas sp. NBWT7]